jgi:hypothetical protein
MATMVQNSTKQSGVSTLDVLWAFYQSQPKSVKKAFRTRMEAEDKSAPVPLWKQDIKEMKALKENWDEEGAPAINRDAIRHSQKLMQMLTDGVAVKVRLFPTHLGAVMVKCETDKGRIKGEVGDKVMSYFVKRPNAATEHYSFEELTKENLQTLVRNLESIA